MPFDLRAFFARRKARQRAVRGLQVRQDWFRLFVAGVSDYSIVMLDTAGLIRSWNAGAERIHGYTAAEALGHHFSMLRAEGEADRSRAELELRRARVEGSFEAEVVRGRKGGDTFLANVALTALIDDGGEVIGFAKVTQDLTQRRAAEQALLENEARLAGIISSAMDAIISTDESRRIIVFNAAAERLFGVPAAEAMGSSLDRFLPERFRRIHATHMEQFGATGVTTRSMHRVRGPLPALRADGTEFPVEATISQAVAAGRRVFTVVLRDVTERVRSEAERDRALQQAEAERAVAEHANRAKSDFLAAMSHELRTPLNAIAGYVDLMALGIHGPVTDAQGMALERIRRNERLLLILINDILQYARIEAGHTELQLSDVPIAEALEDLVPLIEPQVRAAELGYEYSVDGGQPLHVRGDRERIEQILLNLLSNAVKFTAAGGAIQITAEADDAAVQIRVRDTGRGIPGDMLEKIFDPFVQVDRHAHARSQQGVGLGLSISRELARRMGGELAVESTPGLGSTFTLVLPRVHVAS